MMGVRALFSVTMDVLQIEKIDEEINHLAGIDIMPTIITISLVIHI